MKLVVPIADLTKQIPLPGAFLHFIGLCECAGGLGLILPSLLRIRPNLTPIAAGGLVIIMSGAIGISMAGGAIAPAVPPFVIGLLAGLVAYGRSRVAPIQERPRAAVRHPERRSTPAALYGLDTVRPDSAR
jgi:DoxX-like family